MAIYDSAFWRSMGLAGQAFSRVGPMVEIHDASSTAGAGHALFGFIGLPAGQRRQLGVTALQAACQQQLAELFGPAAATPLSTHLKDWAEDPLIASAHDLNHAHGHPELDLTPWIAALRHLQLDLAGSEFATQDAGYLEGALCAVDAVRGQWVSRLV